VGCWRTLDSDRSDWRQCSRSVRSGTLNRELFVTLHDAAVVPGNSRQGAGEPVQLWQPEASAQLAGSAQPRDAQSADKSNKIHCWATALRHCRTPFSWWQRAAAAVENSCAADAGTSRAWAPGPQSSGKWPLLHPRGDAGEGPREPTRG